MAGVFNPSIFNTTAFNTGPAGGGGPIFNIGSFNTLIFNTGDEVGVTPPAVVTKTGTGGIDPGEGLRRRRHIIKPTGTLHLPHKEGRKEVIDRIDESRGIQAEIAARLAREFTEETLARIPIAEMSAAEVDYEIGVLLRKRLRTEEEELMLLLLMVASTV